MSTSHTILDRRHRHPVVPASDLRIGDVFLNPYTGRTETFAGSLDDTFDLAQLVNLEAAR